jgi:hypothetical protein
MWVKKIIVASATVLALLCFAQGGLAQPPRIKTFTESKVTFFATRGPTFVQYADKGGRCLLPPGTFVQIINKIKTALFAQVDVPQKDIITSNPCTNGAIIRMSEEQFVVAYNFAADYNNRDLIAVDVDPIASSQVVGD